MLPYEMFDINRSAEEARRADKLENIYHKGQSLAWNGRETLSALIAKHGPPKMEETHRLALGRVFSILMWGELAAWKISAQLADKLVSLEAKMAATSQAFDEARHFYVLHDYLDALGAIPSRPDVHTEAVLNMVLKSDEIPEKLQGMQLLIENIALTIFHFVKELKLEPVLTELLPYYEKDEARHVGLGVQELPQHLKPMSFPRRMRFIAFQVTVVTRVLFGLKAIEPDLKTLGVPVRRVLEDGTKKIEGSMMSLLTEGGLEASTVREVVRRCVAAGCEVAFPKESQASVKDRLVEAYAALRRPIEQVLSGR